jgi:hypothetical protein
MQLNQVEEATQSLNARAVDEKDTLLDLAQIAAAARQEQEQEHGHGQGFQQPATTSTTERKLQERKPFKRSATNDFHVPVVYQMMPTDQTHSISFSPSTPGQKLYGPEPGVRHKTFGNPPPNEHGHLRLVTHPAGRNVQFNKGVGVEVFEVDGITGAPPAGVTERLEIKVHQVNGAKPGEQPNATVQQGERFLAAAIRDTPLPMADKQAGEQPKPGLNWWRISGNKFRFIYGESSKFTAGRMHKGIVRCASWQLRYSQVMSRDGKETEIFAHTVPETFIIRSSCAEIDERNAECKRAMDRKKAKVIKLLIEHGCTQRLSLKRPYSTLVSFAAAMGLTVQNDEIPEARYDEAGRNSQRGPRWSVSIPNAGESGFADETAACGTALPHWHSSAPREDETTSRILLDAGDGEFAETAAGGTALQHLHSSALLAGSTVEVKNETPETSDNEAAGKRRRVTAALDGEFVGHAVALQRRNAPVKPAAVPVACTASSMMAMGTGSVATGYSGRSWAL